MDQYGNIREYVWEYSGTCKGMCKVKNDSLPKILSNIFCQTKITPHNFIRQPGAMVSFERTVYHGPKKSHVPPTIWDILPTSMEEVFKS